MYIMDKMCALPLSACRVCLASDREMYRLANTALEETYERVTSGTLVVEGRPCCVCGVCLSALRRCRRFIDTAREANDALDRWIRNQPNTDTLELTERPLFSFTRSPVKLVEITSQSIHVSRVKQVTESDTAGNEDSKMIHFKDEATADDKGNILTEVVKYEVMKDDGNDHTQVPDCETDKIKMSNDNFIGSHNSEVTHSPVYVHFQEDTIDDIDTLIPKFDFSDLLDNVRGKTAPGISNVRRNSRTSSQKVALRKSKKKVKPTEDTKSGPALKKLRPITSEHRRGNTTEPAAAQHSMLIYSCLQCSYKNTKKSLLLAHLRIHSDKKPFLCDKCGYKCLKKGDLKLHIMIHTGEKPFPCDKCDLKFSTKYKLKQHSKVHSGEKPVACDKCDYKCRDNGNLKRHLMSHTGERPFVCDKCDYRCIQKVSLMQHLRIHTGETAVSSKKTDCKSKHKSDFI